LDLATTADSPISAETSSVQLKT